MIYARFVSPSWSQDIARATHGEPGRLIWATRTEAIVAVSDTYSLAHHGQLCRHAHLDWNTSDWNAWSYGQLLCVDAQS